MRNFFNRVKIDIFGTIKNVLGEFENVFNNKDLDKVGGVIGLIGIAVSVYKQIRENAKSEGEKAFASLLEFVLEILDDSFKELHETIEKKINKNEGRSFINGITDKFKDRSVWRSFLDAEWNGNLSSHPIVVEIMNNTKALLESHNYDTEIVKGFLAGFKLRIDNRSENNEQIKDFYQWAEIPKQAQRLQGYLTSIEKMKEYAMDFDKKPLHQYYVEQDAVLLETNLLDDKEDKEIREEKQVKIRRIDSLIREFLKEGYHSWLRIIGVPSFGIGRTSMVRMIASYLATEYLDSPASSNNFIPVTIFLNEKNPFDHVYEDLDLKGVLQQIIAPKHSQRKREILLMLDGLEGYSDTEKLMDVLKKIRNGDVSEESYENMKIIITTIYKKDLLEEQKIQYNTKHIRLLSFSEPQINQFFKNYFKGTNRVPLTYERISDSGLSPQEITKPLFAWMISFIDADLKIFNKNWDEKTKRSFIYLLFFHYASKQKYQLEQEWRQEYVKEKIALRRIAALKKVLGENLVVQKKDNIFTIDHVVQFDDPPKNIPTLALSYVNLSNRTINDEDMTETYAIKFVHESFGEYLLAEYYIDSILNDRLHRLNIGIPSEEAVHFLDGLISILLIDDQNIRNEYLEPLLKSFNYKDKIDLQTLSHNIVKKCLDYVEQEQIIFFNRSKDTIKRPETWICAEIVSDDYRQLWIYRWISLFFLSKVSEANVVNQRDYPDLKAEIIHLITYSGNIIPGYMKNLKTLKLNLKNADLSDAYLAHADLSHAALSGAQLSRANLKQANLSECDLSFADLYRANLIYTKLSHANLHFANLQKNDLERADLSCADLTGANFYIADLQRSKLTGANLRMVNIAYSNLNEADLTNSLIIDVEEYENLRCYHANFKGATINNAKLVEYLRRNGALQVSDALTNIYEINHKLSNWYSEFTNPR